MGTRGSKGRRLGPFSSAVAAGLGGSLELTNTARAQNAQAQARGFRTAPSFVFTCHGSTYYDEDGDKFYEETIVTKNGRKRAKLRWVQKNLIPLGIMRLDHGGFPGDHLGDVSPVAPSCPHPKSAGWWVCTNG
uniref:Tumor suppressor 2, mitochondrial calcium regulator n=1 Tax=Vombatus ursinus TaxID=29139 RepID=A0A4X2M927_VOMUR